MNMTLRQLKAFVWVSNTGSYTEAAAQLCLSQSAVSRLVLDLERELGTRLIERTTRKLQLTDTGAEFYKRAQTILSDLSSAVVMVQNLESGPRPELKVAATSLMSCTLLPRVISRYQAINPSMRIKLHDCHPDRVIEEVRSGAAHLGIGPESANGQELVHSILMKDRHFLACRPDHPLASKGEVSWQEAQAYPFVMLSPDYTSRLLLHLSMASRNIVLDPAFEVSYLTTALGMVSAGLGVAACPSFSRIFAPTWGLTLLPLREPDFVRDICVFREPAASITEPIQRFLEVLAECAAEDSI